MEGMLLSTSKWVGHLIATACQVPPQYNADVPHQTQYLQPFYQSITDFEGACLAPAQQQPGGKGMPCELLCTPAGLGACRWVLHEVRQLVTSISAVLACGSWRPALVLRTLAGTSPSQPWPAAPEASPLAAPTGQSRAPRQICQRRTSQPQTAMLAPAGGVKSKPDIRHRCIVDYCGQRSDVLNTRHVGSCRRVVA